MPDTAALAAFRLHPDPAMPAMLACPRPHPDPLLRLRPASRAGSALSPLCSLAFWRRHFAALQRGEESSGALAQWLVCAVAVPEREDRTGLRPVIRAAWEARQCDVAPGASPGPVAANRAHTEDDGRDRMHRDDGPASLVATAASASATGTASRAQAAGDGRDRTHRDDGPAAPGAAVAPASATGTVSRAQAAGEGRDRRHRDSGPASPGAAAAPASATGTTGRAQAAGEGRDHMHRDSVPARQAAASAAIAAMPPAPAATRGGPLRNGNPRGNPNIAPRCGARTRSGCPCRAPAMRGRLRCRMHGGASTGPRTEVGLARLRAARTIHGRYAATERARNRHQLSLLRRTRVLLEAIRLETRLPPVARARLHAVPAELEPPPYPSPDRPPPSRAEDQAMARAEATALAPWKQAIGWARAQRQGRPVEGWAQAIDQLFSGLPPPPWRGDRHCQAAPYTP